jgi:hypothetical protein
MVRRWPGRRAGPYRDGDLVEIQRATPTGYETLAIAGDDLLVSIEPATCVPVEAGKTSPEPVQAAGRAGAPHLVWHPTGDPLD